MYLHFYKIILSQSSNENEKWIMEKTKYYYLLIPQLLCNLFAIPTARKMPFHCPCIPIIISAVTFAFNIVIATAIFVVSLLYP